MQLFHPLPSSTKKSYCGRFKVPKEFPMGVWGQIKPKSKGCRILQAAESKGPGTGSERGEIQLLAHHPVQKGPAGSDPLGEAATGMVGTEKATEVYLHIQ